MAKGIFSGSMRECEGFYFVHQNTRLTFLNFKGLSSLSQIQITDVCTIIYFME